MKRWLATTFLLLLIAPLAQAATVKLLYNSRQAYVGVPFLVAVEVKDADDHQPPQFTQLPGAEVLYVDKRQSNSSFSITINGRNVTQGGISMQYIYRVTPEKPGLLKIPPIPVEADGQTLHTQEAIFQVVKSEPGDLLYVDLKASDDSVYVGERLTLTLEVWLRPYNRDGVSLDANDMWNTFASGSDWGVFTDLIEADRPSVTVHRANRMGDDGEQHTYFVYVVEKNVWPDRAGALDVGDIRIVVDYPERLERSRGFGFGFSSRLRVAESRPIAVGITDAPIMIKAIPTEGRPSYYRGAVGKHTIEVTAKPTNVHVGDPITLNMVVRGAGQLSLTQAPPLAELSEFTSHFQVPNEQLPGVVDNGSKKFSQSIRALSEDVTEIPAIPLAYFDPEKEKFVTVYSDPIPIKVAPVQRMSAAQIVESGDPIGIGATRLTQLDKGMQGNYTNTDGLLIAQGFQPGIAHAVVAGAAPAFYLICMLVGWRSRRLASNVGLVRRRAAYKSANNRLKAARSAKNSADVASAVAATLLGYVADRVNVPAGGLTRAEALDRLRQCGLSHELAQETDGILSDCESLEFGGSSVETGDLINRVSKCLTRLEHTRF